MGKMTIFFYLFIALACNMPATEKGGETATVSDKTPDITLNPEFGNYWYQGEAELTSYKLEQARYGQVHDGEAVLVFVTEPFSKTKQVKLDDPSKNPEDAVTVLKCNFMKKFYTGIYPYSMMMSAFTPVNLNEHPHTLKVTTSVQEWCGHVFTQINMDEKAYRYEHRSYFESEGDESYKLEQVMLEDEIWNRIRIAPESLPAGNIEIIPSTFFSRLRHIELKKTTARATLGDDPENPALSVYTLQYHTPDRTLKIHFQKAFPHEIQSWEETYVSGFGKAAETLTTKATLKERVKTDYWTKNSLADSTWRKKLDLRAW